jgi:hypothetical protein
MLFGETVAVYCENHTEHIRVNTLYGQRSYLVLNLRNVNAPVGIYGSVHAAQVCRRSCRTSTAMWIRPVNCCIGNENCLQTRFNSLLEPWGISIVSNMNSFPWFLSVPEDGTNLLWSGLVVYPVRFPVQGVTYIQRCFMQRIFLLFRHNACRIMNNTQLNKRSVKTVSLWDKMPCSPLKINPCFGGIYRFHLHDRRISRARNQLESMWQVAWRWRLNMFLRNSGWLSTVCTALYPAARKCKVLRWAQRLYITSATGIVQFLRLLALFSIFSVYWWWWMMFLVKADIELGGWGSVEPLGMYKAASCSRMLKNRSCTLGAVSVTRNKAKLRPSLYINVVS